MEEYQYCESCGNSYQIEIHHIIFRSQGGFDIPINYKHLCGECHRTKSSSPHLSKATNLKYKREMQTTLEKILCKDYYTESELKEILKFKSNQLTKLCKRLTLHDKGYARLDVIRRVMGGKVY